MCFMHFLKYILSNTLCHVHIENCTSSMDEMDDAIAFWNCMMQSSDKGWLDHFKQSPEHCFYTFSFLSFALD